MEVMHYVIPGALRRGSKISPNGVCVGFLVEHWSLLVGIWVLSDGLWGHRRAVPGRDEQRTSTTEGRCGGVPYRRGDPEEG